MNGTEYVPEVFAEKYLLARETAINTQPEAGVCGIELEWNLLDEGLRPLLTVGSGPQKQSFVDYLRANVLSPWVREYSQLEVFHWMIEWATRPHFTSHGAVFEGRLMEGVLLNALHQAGDAFGQDLYAWPGNLLFNTQVNHDSIPGSWHIAKRRYLERCVDLYGDSLATAGTHINLSLPEPLLAWDFMHLSAGERGDTQLDGFKSRFYIRGTRLLRAFAALFIATSAATPLQAQEHNGKSVVVLTDYDSVRNLTFPNPTSLDVPDLYRSYEDYLHLSYDLVRRGVRFGNNNWTLVRARSFAEPVERMIFVTSEQLEQLYRRGLYASGEAHPVDDMAVQIEIQNLLARIDIPMSRIEIRTDDSGHSLDIEVANLLFKHLLLLRIYADPTFAVGFRYDQEDLARARRNEMVAAKTGLRGVIENPMTGKPVGMREFLQWTLDAIMPLAKALDCEGELEPLQKMAGGGDNTAAKLRRTLQNELGQETKVPVDLLRELAQQRKELVGKEISTIAEQYRNLPGDAQKLRSFIQRSRENVRALPSAPVRFRPRPTARLERIYPDKTGEIVAVAKALIRIPSVTACPDERLDEVRRAATWIYDYAQDCGLDLRIFNKSKYPALLIGFPGSLYAPVMLAGHFDVVAPEPDEGQFDPRIEGDYLWGRGAADMKTVVATYLVWMKDQLQSGPPYPGVNLLLVGNEENGEEEAMGSPHVLSELMQKDAYAPDLFIAGERTEETGKNLWGSICVENRGIARFTVKGFGVRGHTGTKGVQKRRELTEILLEAREKIQAILEQGLTTSSEDGWQSQVRFPFIQVGTPDIYNISAAEGVLGVEVRPIPQNDLTPLIAEIKNYCDRQGLLLETSIQEDGIQCDASNLYLRELIGAVKDVKGGEVELGRKLAGTSARFAPGGQGVVWGQSGSGPHSATERHFISSIEPYYQALVRLGQRMISTSIKEESLDRA